MKKQQKLIARNLVISIGLLSTISISNPLADDLNTAANAAFGKLKLAPQAGANPFMPPMGAFPMSPFPIPQGQAPMMPPAFMSPPAGTMPTDPMQAPSMPQGPAPVLPPEFMPAAIAASAAAPSMPTPTAPLTAEEMGPPPTVTIDGNDPASALPAPEGPDPSAGTGNAGPNDGSVGPTGN